MDISKIQFGQLSQSKDIEKAFEDLDVNNDGVINEKDTAAATNKALSAEITNLLNEVDNDADVEILGDFVDDTNSVKSSAISVKNTLADIMSRLFPFEER